MRATPERVSLVRMGEHQLSSDMATESSTGTMEPIMKDNGATTKLKARELSGMQRAMFITENLKMTWQMAMENTPISMDLVTKENLEMTFKRDMEKKNGSMELSTWEHT